MATCRQPALAGGVLHLFAGPLPALLNRVPAPLPGLLLLGAAACRCGGGLTGLLPLPAMSAAPLPLLCHSAVCAGVAGCGVVRCCCGCCLPGCACGCLGRLPPSIIPSLLLHPSPPRQCPVAFLSASVVACCCWLLSPAWLDAPLSSGARGQAAASLDSTIDGLIGTAHPNSPPPSSSSSRPPFALCLFPFPGPGLHPLPLVADPLAVLVEGVLQCINS